ncbi:MAG: thioredoxin family protein, partial [Myxococcota bacterium]|nr:thioredoxin family protein [Myxococcota bacterium]
VNAQGVLVYDGAVDNAPLGRLKGQEHQVWLAEALDEVTSDRPVSRPRSKAYGCTVKYDG